MAPAVVPITHIIQRHHRAKIVVRDMRFVPLRNERILRLFHGKANVPEHLVTLGPGSIGRFVRMVLRSESQHRSVAQATFSTEIQCSIADPGPGSICSTPQPMSSTRSIMQTAASSTPTVLRVRGMTHASHTTSPIPSLSSAAMESTEPQIVSSSWRPVSAERYSPDPYFDDMPQVFSSRRLSEDLMNTDLPLLSPLLRSLDFESPEPCRPFSLFTPDFGSSAEAAPATALPARRTQHLPRLESVNAIAHCKHEFFVFNHALLPMVLCCPSYKHLSSRTVLIHDGEWVLASFLYLYAVEETDTHALSVVVDPAVQSVSISGSDTLYFRVVAS